MTKNKPIKSENFTATVIINNKTYKIMVRNGEVLLCEDINQDNYMEDKFKSSTMHPNLLINSYHGVKVEEVECMIGDKYYYTIFSEIHEGHEANVASENPNEKAILSVAKYKHAKILVINGKLVCEPYN